MGNAFVYEVSFGEKILSGAMRDKEGTMAFRFEKPPGFDFKHGQSKVNDLTGIQPLSDPGKRAPRGAISWTNPSFCQ